MTEDIRLSYKEPTAAEGLRLLKWAAISHLVALGLAVLALAAFLLRLVLSSGPGTGWSHWAWLFFGCAAACGPSLALTVLFIGRADTLFCLAHAGSEEKWRVMCSKPVPSEAMDVAHNASRILPPHLLRPILFPLMGHDSSDIRMVAIALAVQPQAASLPRLSRPARVLRAILRRRSCEIP